MIKNHHIFSSKLNRNFGIFITISKYGGDKVEILKQQLYSRLRKEWLSYQNYITQNFDKSSFISKAYEIFCMKEIADNYTSYTGLEEESLRKLLQYNGSLLNYLYSEYMRVDNDSVTSSLCDEVDTAINRLEKMNLF